MYYPTAKRILYIIFLVGFLGACGNNHESSSQEKIKEVKSSSKILNAKCNKIINEYDDLVERSIDMAMKAMDGEEVDKLEETKIKADGERLAKKIQTLGVTGLGGTECWQEFVDVQMKWTHASMELQKKALDKAQETMNEHQMGN